MRRSGDMSGLCESLQPTFSWASSAPTWTTSLRSIGQSSCLRTFHPDYQGRGYFSFSSRRVLGFTHHRFAVTHQKAMIHWTNTEVAEMAVARGLVNQGGMTPQGYETYIAPLPQLPDAASLAEPTR